jgi:hypothetical protein
LLAKRTAKIQITLPKGIVKFFSDTEYFDVSVEGNRILLMPVKITEASADYAKLIKELNIKID